MLLLGVFMRCWFLLLVFPSYAVENERLMQNGTAGSYPAFWCGGLWGLTLKHLCHPASAPAPGAAASSGDARLRTPPSRAGKGEAVPRQPRSVGVQVMFCSPWLRPRSGSGRTTVSTGGAELLPLTHSRLLVLALLQGKNGHGNVHSPLLL